MEKPRVLILGGCGFIGRNLVCYLISNDLVSVLRVVDKVPPQVAWLNKECNKHFQDPAVEFKSANLINSESCKNSFSASSPWDYVINCAGETRLGQTDAIYKEGILNLSLNCAKQAAQHQVKHYVEMSCGKMSSSDKVPHKEDGTVEPWSLIAKWKLEVEKEFRNIPNLNYTIVRPAIVYGPGDRTGLTPRIMGAAIYKHLGETMKLLWNADLKLNTIHVKDLCRAIWFICQRSDTIGQVYNTVDEGESTQGTISSILAQLFGIKVDYYNKLVSAMVDLEDAAEEANDKHLTAWAEVCRKDAVLNTPLTPHMEVEQLLHKHVHLDGSKLKTLGFEHNFPELNADNVREIVEDFIQMNIFPHSLGP